MTVAGWLEIAAFCGLLVAVTPLLGGYMARVFAGEVTTLAWAERRVYRLLGTDPGRGMDWKRYARAVLR